MTSAYTSVKAVLFDISQLIDDRYWNEAKMLEWATKGLRQLNLEIKFETCVHKTTLVDYKASLPLDLKYIIQVAYQADTLLNTNTLSTPRLMRLQSSAFNRSLCFSEVTLQCSDCNQEFSVSPSMVLTSTLKEGTISVAYLKFPTDEDGYALIPDDETVKEAIKHFCLYQYWMSKYTMKEDGADNRMQFHYSMWSTLSKKALTLNSPDTNTMENIKNNFNRLVPRSNQADSFFLNLGNKENVNF